MNSLGFVSISTFVFHSKLKFLQPMYLLSVDFLSNVASDTPSTKAIPFLNKKNPRRNFTMIHGAYMWRQKRRAVYLITPGELL